MSRHLLRHAHAGGAKTPRLSPFPPRILLAVADPALRRTLARELEAEGIHLALVSGAAQMVERAVVVCCEEIARRSRPSNTDFDLVLIDADSIEWPLDFVCSLREVGYQGLVAGLASTNARRKELLDAGFVDLVLVDRARPASLLPRLRHNPHIAAALRQRSWQDLVGARVETG
jgi:hypothetical protein